MEVGNGSVDEMIALGKMLYSLSDCQRQSSPSLLSVHRQEEEC